MDRGQAIGRAGGPSGAREGGAALCAQHAIPLSKPSPRGAVVTDGLGEDQAFMMTRVRRHNRPHDEPRGAVRHMEGATGGPDGRRRRRPDEQAGTPALLAPSPRPPPPRNKAVLLGPVLLCLSWIIIIVIIIIFYYFLFHYVKTQDSVQTWFLRTIFG